MVFVSIDNSTMSKRVFMDVLHDNGNSNHGHIHGLSCDHESQFSWSSLAMEHISHGHAIHPLYTHGQLLFSWFTGSINLWSEKSMVKFMSMAHGQPHGFFTQGGLLRQQVESSLLAGLSYGWALGSVGRVSGK